VTRDEKYMTRALELARRAMGRTRPNPLVGCVIVRNDTILGEGYHHRAGEDHAEVMALNNCTSDTSGAELFVNHEPCCHHGRTPPCTDAIVKAGIRRVVVGVIDPDRRVSGKGIEALQKAGIEVICGVLEDESRALNAPFFRYTQAGRPYVVAKWAMSLDGKIATTAGESQWITGEAARHRVHQLRDTHDAILIGKSTLLADNPSLTCRIEDGRDPVRFVVDTRLEAPLTHHVFSHPVGQTVVLAGFDANREKRAALIDRGVEVAEIHRDERGWLDPTRILHAIHERQCMSVLVEGGGALLGSLFDRHLIDYVYAFVAPVLIGGAHASSPLQGRGVESMMARTNLISPVVESLGPDTLIHGRCGPTATPSFQ
jgi:diaminohydroxyphosphoribosylaminopyrimidine deaminase / 5-amino-6-(5-phosphoribosylamino)uracil reductase